MDVLLTYLAKGLVLPPAANLLLLFGAWCLRRSWRRLARALAAFAIVTLYAGSTPLGAALLAEGLEATPPFDLASEATPRIAAIVVPGTGRYTSPPEYGADTVSNRTLERLRYAARVHRTTGWPIATVGGSPLDDASPEGVLMAESLQDDFNVPVRWIEHQSRNTAENARNARAIIDVDTILLVTQAMDMPRARRAFEAVGFEVIPAPIGFVNRQGDYAFSPFDFVPDANALAVTRVALHEYLGLLWYALRY
jgi:uncharacterized SAM-binding protein YcdF (DUF218 family)